MRKIAIIAASAFVAACSSGDYVTDVTSESYQEEYEIAVAEPTTIDEVDVVIPSDETQQVTITTESGQTPGFEKQHPRLNYTIQIISMNNAEKVLANIQPLPEGQPVWRHDKQVNGTELHAVLYGDYATQSEAKAALAALPDYFQKLRPFVRSLDKIKNSPSPKLIKLR